MMRIIRYCVLMVIMLSGESFTQELVGSVSVYGAKDLFISGTYVFTIDYSYGMRVVDVGNPTSPVVVTGVPFNGALAGTMVGNLVYVANGTGLVILDASDPLHSFIAGVFETPGYAMDVAIHGNLAYIADGSDMYWRGGLQIIDINDPAHPVSVSYDNTFSCEYVNVIGDFIYAGSPGGSQVLDISNPISPVRVDFTMGDDIIVSGSCAFVAADYNDLRIYDISNVGNPISIEEHNRPGSAKGLSMSGNFLFVAYDFMGVEIMDVSNPSMPVVVGSCAVVSGSNGWVPGSHDVVVAGDYAYVTSRSCSLEIFDVSNFTYSFAADANSVDNNLSIKYELSSVIPGDADSIGIWLKCNTAPVTLDDPVIELLGTYSVGDSMVIQNMEIEQDSIYCISAFAKDRSGTWFDTPIAHVTARTIYNFSTDSLIVRELLDSNGLSHIAVRDVAYEIDGRIHSLNLAHKEIRNLPENLADLHRVKNIDLFDNNLTTLPTGIIGLTDLKTLKLSANKLHLSGTVKNWALGYDELYQFSQDSLREQLFINDKYGWHSCNGYIQKSVLVVQPMGSFTENSIYLTYSDCGKYPTSALKDLLEINHFFDLPDSAVVTDMWLWMGDSIMQAKMIDVTTATEIYDSIVGKPERIDPAILKKDGNYYELSIYPYVSGTAARVKITYITPVNIVNDSAFAHVPVSMLDLSNNNVKPLSILFKEHVDVSGRIPRIRDVPDALFKHNTDTLTYRYLEAEIDDITFYQDICIAYKADALDADTAIEALMLANENINNLLEQYPLDTTAIIDSSIHYNILTDFTALLALEPDATNHFMVNPLDEGQFVDETLVSTDEVLSLVESIAFKIDPNPFTTSTSFTFTLKQASHVALDIYSPAGAHLRTIHSGGLPAGPNTVRWDGRTGAGASLEKGTYIYRIDVDGKTACGKVMKF